ncbi:MFS transporter [Rhizobium leguminosarum]|uniref:MFS transporter n=1 Tax=Rhizobium leguminosarum TaxID=384 RepID=UPI0021BC1E5A|nr:MFS transporter [Rhizobium leguminosarum]MBY5775430.1 MFS transporter [Rhizobium leguminosarum]
MTFSEPTLRHLATGSLSRSVLLVLSASSGLAVANSYYNQPMLGALSSEFGLTAAAATVVPVVTQFGNASGVLFIAPLGDRVERKRLILITTSALVAALIAAAVSPSFLWLIVASFFVGLFATVAQQLVPLSVHIAPADMKGQVLGTVTGGILLGILLSRTLSGFVTDWWNWQVMFWIAAALMTSVCLVLAWKLPRVAATTSIGYFSLIASLWSLVREHGVLRRAVLVQAAIFAAFLAFWSNLALLLSQEPYHLGASVVGLIALVGAGGALAAPLSGRLADKRGSEAVISVGAAMVIAAFAIFLAIPGSIIALVIGVIVMDLGVQSSQVANQARAYALDPTARSRLNTIFMATMLFGGSLGAGAGGIAFSNYGWAGTCSFGAFAATIALLIAMRKPATN